MTTSSAKPQPWDIWLAYVRFADRPEAGKVRPIVILENNVAAVIAAKVTSAGDDAKFAYCNLEDWAIEGLRKPSRVQVSPLFEIHMQDILRDTPRTPNRCRQSVAAKCVAGLVTNHG